VDISEIWPYVEDIARREDPDRFRCALFATGGHRRYMMALLAFNWEIARVREIISEPIVGEIRLEWWREAIDEIYAGCPRAHPIVNALAIMIEDRDIPAALFHQMIDARALDIDAGGPANMDALQAYAAGTGGALHELQMHIAGGSGELLKAARSAGTAWALTGLLRAVGFHASMNKLYLPEDEMAALGLGAGDIYRGEFSDELRQVLKQIGSASRAQIAWARELSKDATRRQMSPLLCAPLAADYLARMESADFYMHKCDFSKGQLKRLLKLLSAYMLGRI
jgi:NADH dehydrogenase [ubiquinone] 1 alpha subcomplex assembly factor 6